ncbi:MAG: IS481 family transposase, partial [Chromatiaceae bacterium]|nr:IS481 family transposase [Chromatiaceae bacterium]MBP9603274.1 IS481 family transposase [Chromatiaceae bacterium]
YNHQIPQRALGHLSPVQALQDWQEKCPALFKKKVYNLTGLDSYSKDRFFPIQIPAALQEALLKAA